MADAAPEGPNRGPVVLAVTIGLLCVSTLFVVLRLISRIGVVKRVTPDDYFIVLAWFIAFGFSFSICYGTSVGLGRHEAAVKPQWQKALKRSEYAFSVLYNPALMATKTSICLFYLTLAKNQQVFKWATLITLAVVNIAGMALTLLNIFRCHPVGAVLDAPLPPSEHCIDIITIYLSSAPVNIVTDLALFFLPLPILTGMRLPRNEKLILIVTFSFGAFVAIVDVVRIAYLESATLTRLQDNTGKADKSEQGDFSWIASLSFMWSAVEVHVGMICACVPGVKPLVAKVFPNLLGKMKYVKDMSVMSGHFYGPGEGVWADRQTRTRAATPANSPIATSFPTHVHDEGPPIDFLDFLTTPEDGQKHQSGTQEEDLGGMNFVTAPDSPTALRNRDTISTVDTRKSRSASLTPFDFVNMNDRKSLVKMSNRESLAPIAFVTILFFLWGFAYGLLNVLNSQFQLIVGVSTGQSIALHSAYYGAYLIAPLTFGGLVLRKWGFKSTFIVGLCVYGVGTLIFWPSAVLASFTAFLISNFIIGLGVATLELAGNPFISFCGPPEHAEVRLNISQAVQAIGTVVSPLLAKKVMFQSVRDAPSLIDVQWAYLGIAMFVVVLALVFYYVPLPEASDDDLEDLALENVQANTRKVGDIQVIYLTLALGAFSNFCYVGGQEAISTRFQDYITVVKPNSDIGPFNYFSIGHTVFAVGRFLTAFAGLIFRPRWILLFLYVGLIITTALTMSLEGYAGVSMIVLVQLFESGIFSLIFAMCIRGLGAHTKFGAVVLTASTSGGAVIPAIMSPVRDSRGLRYAFAVAVAVFAFGSILPLYTATVPAAKDQINPMHHSDGSPTAEDGVTVPKGGGRALSTFRRRRKTSAETPRAEHVESDKEKEPG